VEGQVQRKETKGEARTRCYPTSREELRKLWAEELMLTFCAQKSYCLFLGSPGENSVYFAPALIP
jgi:hypothetical protein